MTHHTTGHTTRNANRPPGPTTARIRAIVGRLAAAVTLLVILAVPPTLLLHFAGSPLEVPDSLRNSRALTSPTDDHILMWMLAGVAWIAWARLIGCLTLEAIAQVRGISLRMPLPGMLLGADRLLATHLIAALLMTSQLGAHGTADPLTPVAGQVTGSVQLTRAAATSAVPGMATSPSRRPTLTHNAEGVQPYAPLSELSAGSPAATDAQHVAPGKAGSAIECAVLPPAGRHHDTLWDIADRHLGDGLRWREIFAMNEGRIMPDGQRLTDASLIRPGWILRLPTDATMLAIDQVRTQPDRTNPGPPRSERPGPSERPTVAPVSPAPDTVPPAAGDDTRALPAPPVQTAGPAKPATSQGPTKPSTASQQSNDHEAHDDAHDDAHNEDEPAALPAAAIATLGSLLLAASALLASLTRRRKLAARRRPPGVRATRPAPEVLEAERRLRRQAHRAEDISATIRLALLVAAKAEQPITVMAVWEHPDGTIELVLADPCPAAPSPFEASGRGWQLTPEGQRFLYAVRINGSRKQDRFARLENLLQQSADPFPALLPVGTEDGSACLVNLEPLGLISLSPGAAHQPDQLDGPDDHVSPDIEAILQGWAQAFAGAPWAELTHLHLPQQGRDISIGLDQVSAADLLDPARSAGLRSAALHLDPEKEPAATLQEARISGAGGGDTIRLHVSLGFTPQAVPAWLPAAARNPLDANVLLLAGHHPDAHLWCLNADGTVTIPGIAEHLQPLRLDPDEHALQLRLLEHAEDPPHAEPDDPQRAQLLAQCPPQAPPVNNAHVVPVPESRTDADLVIDLTDLTRSAPPSPTAPEHEAEPESVHEPDAPTPPAATEAVPPRASDSPDHLPTMDDGDDVPPVTADEVVADADAVDTDVDDTAAGRVAAADPDLPAGPVEVRILGPLEVDGTSLDAPRKQALDVLVYLALHRRPVTSDVLFEAVWPDKGFNGRTLRNRVSEVRGYIPPGVEYARGGYQLPDLVQTDWQRFQALAKGDAEAQLSALRLVRGRPFEGMTLDWIHLEGHFAEIEAAIVDLALHVGTEALRGEQYDLAREACYAGLRGCPYEERLYRIGMESASARGATAELRELRRRLELVLAEEVDDDLQPATRELYQRLHDEDELRRRRHERHA